MADQNYNYNSSFNGKSASAEKLTVNRDNARNNSVTAKAGGEFRHSTDDGSHLIARVLNGDQGEKNVVAMDKSINRGSYRSMERSLVNAVEHNPNGSVTLKVNTFGGDKHGGLRRPDVVTADAALIDKNGAVKDVQHKSWTNLDKKTLGNLYEESGTEFQGYVDTLTPEERKIANEESMAMESRKIDDGLDTGWIYHQLKKGEQKTDRTLERKGRSGQEDKEMDQYAAFRESQKVDKKVMESNREQFKKEMERLRKYPVEKAESEGREYGSDSRKGKGEKSIVDRTSSYKIDPNKKPPNKTVQKTESNREKMMTGKKTASKVSKSAEFRSSLQVGKAAEGKSSKGKTAVTTGKSSNTGKGNPGGKGGLGSGGKGGLGSGGKGGSGSGGKGGSGSGGHGGSGSGGHGGSGGGHGGSGGHGK